MEDGNSKTSTTGEYGKFLSFFYDGVLTSLGLWFLKEQEDSGGFSMPSGIPRKLPWWKDKSEKVWEKKKNKRLFLNTSDDITILKSQEFWPALQDK